MHGVLAAEFVTTLRSLDGINVADQVSDSHVRSRQLFDVALLRCEICNRGLVGILGQQFAAAAADGRVRIVVNLAAAQIRQLWVEQRGKRAQDAALRLSTQSEKNKVVP